MLFKDYDWYIEHEGSALCPEIELGLRTTKRIPTEELIEPLELMSDSTIEEEITNPYKELDTMTHIRHLIHDCCECENGEWYWDEMNCIGEDLLALTRDKKLLDFLDYQYYLDKYNIKKEDLY